MRDATQSCNAKHQLGNISIHASHAGRDPRKTQRAWTYINFNPRVPCGTRLALTVVNHLTDYFNPRVPCGTRLYLKRGNIMGEEFQSTRPMRDATLARSRGQHKEAYFNPRVPCGTRRFCKAVQVQHYFNPRVPCGTRPLF